MTPLVSVLSPTIRGLQALRPIEQSLKDQTCQDFEWLVEIDSGKEHRLNAAFNSMLRRARGKLVVVAEDWLWFERDGLQKFVEAFRSMSGYFFTAPVPKAPGYWEMNGKMFYKTPLVKEWRSENRGEPHWMNWEADWAAAPLKALKDIGWVDERMDQKWACDNQSVAFRASKRGWKFWNLIDNPAVALNHDAFWEHPFRHLYDPEWSKQQIERFEHEDLPPLE